MLILWILIGSALLFILQRVVYSNYWDKKVNISFRFSGRAVTEGESVDLFERCENRKLLPLPTFGYFYTLIRNYISPSQPFNAPMSQRRKLALPGRCAVTNRIRVNGLLRGVYSIDTTTVSSSDLFHTIRLNWTAGCASRLIVYPSKIPVQKLALPARLLLGAVTTRRMAQEDPFALKSIRPYEIYDSPRIINWKASAKTGELKVNQFEYTTDESLLLLLDMGGGEIEDREQLIRLASSLSLFFLHRGVSISLMANCRNIISGKPVRVRSGADITHQITVDEALAQINLAVPVTEPFCEFLSAVSKENTKGALPVVLSADPSGEARQAFRSTPGVRDGYYFFVGNDGSVLPERGPSMVKESDAEREERL